MWYEAQATRAAGQCHYAQQRICNRNGMPRNDGSDTHLCVIHESLVWVAKKVLAQWDLDFVLTEYFKERLESRLKNRETHMDEDNSTEPNVLTTTTYLLVLIDWISSTNTFPPFYTSSFSFGTGLGQDLYKSQEGVQRPGLDTANIFPRLS